MKQYTGTELTEMKKCIENNDETGFIKILNQGQKIKNYNLLDSDLVHETTLVLINALERFGGQYGN